MFMDSVPNQVAFGMKVNFYMNPNQCHNSG